jgi:hypothetical protein
MTTPASRSRRRRSITSPIARFRKVRSMSIVSFDQIAEA